MRETRFLITGCGRSGTGYTAQLLTGLGLRCGHEEVFRIDALRGDKLRWPDSHPGDSSWLAVPFLRDLPEGTAILHQVRDPLAVVRSLLRIRLFETPGPYLDFLCEHLEGLERCAPVEAALRYWNEWNARIEEAAEIEKLRYRRHSLESLDASQVRDLLGFLGHRTNPGAIEAELVARPRDCNTRGEKSADQAFSWSALPAGELRDAVRERATRYGYALESEAREYT